MLSIKTSRGVVNGCIHNGVRQFLGIPYAQPPVGNLRFREPTPAQAWRGALNCSAVGKDAMQVKTPDSFTVPLRSGSAMGEDCLTVNVTAPLKNKPIPVLVWIHGGAFSMGSGHTAFYEPSNFVKTQDVIVVSLNYRVGVFGFLYTKKSGIPPNLGILDQILALEWVQNEISHFGGDPSKVTIMGESAGAMSVGCLLSMKDTVTKDLFRGAILQSGAPAVYSVKLAEKQAQEYAKKLGVSKEELTADTLRKIPAHVLLKAEQDMNIGLINMSPVYVPGGFLPHPFKAFEQGVGENVAVLSGTNKDEFNLWIDGIKGEIKRETILSSVMKRLGTETAEPAERVLNEIERESQGFSNRDVLSQTRTDMMFFLPHNRMLDTFKGTAFSYHLEWEGSGRLKASHLMDIPLVFGTFASPGIGSFIGEHPNVASLSQAVMDCWGSFVRTLNPSTPSISWAPHNSTTRPTAVFGRGNSPKPVLQNRVRDAVLKAWSWKPDAKL